MVAPILKKVFDPIIELDLQVWKNFENLGSVSDLPKESILKQSNSVEGYFNLILKGSGGAILSTERNSVCVDIALENEFLNDYLSFTSQKPSPIEVRLFEDSQIFRVSYQNFQKTMLSGNFGLKVSLLASEEAINDKQQQQIDLLTKSAKTRYLEMLEKRPGLDRIPLKYLASFLGITPQSLSRIRAGKI
ncbi:Crp/Fnr family transcriptional regulator [Algoriphagus lacus]|uniref:Crp/Fnr family transcriptional regulator n=1 Tax=Algoriphagus lacus TaxID=2056311 RepID=A0A418PNR6_9BACT|nr:Crp/Fnr family transcriptional regulator [Algoriphagus lacus]